MNESSDSTDVAVDLAIAPIDGDEVSLSPLRLDDAEPMVEVLADPLLYQFTGGEAPGLDQLTRQYRLQVRGGPADGSQQWLNWIVRLRTRPIGFVQATVENGGDGWSADLAWVIGTQWQGRGRAGEATRLMVQWLHERNVQRFTASIHPQHPASHGVARGLGLVATAALTDDGEQVWNMTLPRAQSPGGSA